MGSDDSSSSSDSEDSSEERRSIRSGNASDDDEVQREPVHSGEEDDESEHDDQPSGGRQEEEGKTPENGTPLHQESSSSSDDGEQEESKDGGGNANGEADENDNEEGYQEKANEDTSDNEEESQRESIDKTTTKDIFGSDVSSDEDDAADNERESRRRDSSSVERSPRREDDESNDANGMAVDEEEGANQTPRTPRGDEDEGNQVEEAPREVEIKVDIPRLVANLGEELYFVKFPNFLSVETHPYDPETYEDEIDEDEVMDEEGKGRLKLKVENTIRWRTQKDKKGQPVIDPQTVQEVKESNARVVRWSDGSYSLHLGSEIFDIHKLGMLSGENNHLFVRQGVGLHGQAVFRTKLSFRPHSTDSFTHRKITLSLADKSQKANKVRIINDLRTDPEADRSEKIKKEEDRLKASIRRENKVRRMRERAHSSGLTSRFVEGDYEEDEDGGVSISAIKNQYKKRPLDVSATYPSDDDDGSDIEVGVRKSDRRKMAKIEESDDD